MGTATSEGHLPARSLIMMMMILMILMKRMETASSEGHLPARSLMMMILSLNNNFGCVQILTDIWEDEQEDFQNFIRLYLRASFDMRI